MTDIKHYEYNADFIEQWLKEKGMIKDEFQKRMGINAQSYYRWVEEKSNPMPVPHILRFCNEFGVDISNFFIINGGAEEFVIPTIAKRRTVSKEQAADESKHKEEMMEAELKHLKEIDEVKTDAHNRERSLMDIIIDQEKEIRKLHQRIDNMRGPVSFSMNADKPYPTYNEEDEYGLRAAEDIPEPEDD